MKKINLLAVSVLSASLLVGCGGGEDGANQELPQLGGNGELIDDSALLGSDGTQKQEDGALAEADNPTYGDLDGNQNEASVQPVEPPEYSLVIQHDAYISNPLSNTVVLGQKAITDEQGVLAYNISDGNTGNNIWYAVKENTFADLGKAENIEYLKILHVCGYQSNEFAHQNTALIEAIKKEYGLDNDAAVDVLANYGNASADPSQTIYDEYIKNTVKHFRELGIEGYAKSPLKPVIHSDARLIELHKGAINDVIANNKPLRFQCGQDNIANKTHVFSLKDQSFFSALPVEFKADIEQAELGNIKKDTNGTITGTVTLPLEIVEIYDDRVEQSQDKASWERLDESGQVAKAVISDVVLKVGDKDILIDLDNFIKEGHVTISFYNPNKITRITSPYPHQASSTIYGAGWGKTVNNYGLGVVQGALAKYVHDKQANAKFYVEGKSYSVNPDALEPFNIDVPEIEQDTSSPFASMRNDRLYERSFSYEITAPQELITNCCVVSMPHFKDIQAAAQYAGLNGFTPEDYPDVVYFGKLDYTMFRGFDVKVNAPAFTGTLDKTVIKL